MKNSKRLFGRVGFAAATLLMIASIVSQPVVGALSTTALKSIIHNTAWYGEDSSVDSSCTTGSGAVVPAGSLASAVPEPWNGIITQAATKYNTSGPLLAALLYWENRAFPDPKKDWGTSSAGAEGPMQFISGTWDTYKADGDGDGKMDVLNNWDAVYGAANLISKNGITPDSPLGTLEQPGKNGTMLRMAANYNWGGGNVDSHGGENITLDDMPKETSDYLRAVYTLISSDFSSLPMADGSNNNTAPIDSSATTTSAIAGDCTTPDLGTGTGSFTDNTSVQIPGAAAAVAKAKEIADAGASTWAQVCAGAAGGVNCAGACERLASVVWGRTSSGYVSAKAHWEALVANGSAHAGDRNPPVGALLFYDNGGTFGHVAVYLGNNMLLSNDVNDSKSGQEGGVYVVSASAMEADGWHLTYLGWGSPVPW